MVMERDIKRDILDWLHRQPEIMAWNSPTGVTRIPGTRRTIAYGSPGSADIIGLIAPTGRFLAVEVKGPRGVQSAVQVAWQRAVQTLGGIYILARSVSDVEQGLTNAGVVL